MTEEQIQYLKENDIPYSPSIFKYCQFKYSSEISFIKYCSYMKLPAYRVFKWKDSAFVEEGAQSWVERICNND